MKTIGIALVMFGLILVNVPVQAEEVNLTSFYMDCIDQKTINCMHKAMLIDARGENLQSCAKDAIQQAAFYQRNKELLVRRMIEQGIGENKAKVSYFLIKVYADSPPIELAEK